MACPSKQLFGGDWTEEKLSILENYLKAYLTALKKWDFEKIYIDAFAGTGYRENREKQSVPDLFAEPEDDEHVKFVKGSAAIALDVDFDKYIFVERDADKVKELNKLKETHPNKSPQIQIINSDANAFVKDYCSKKNWKASRAVLFLDPFATEVEWSTIESIANTNAIDLWILFPLMAINRLLANDPKKVLYDRLNTVFGTEDWVDSFYKKQQLDDIFGEPINITKKACDYKSIGNFYKKRLESMFSGVAEPKVLCNSRKSPLFFLFFASSNPKGAKIAVKIAQHLLKEI